MAEISISFNGSIYRLDESVLSDATAELKHHLSNVMNGTGAIINIDGTSFNIDSTKLSTATSDLVAHLGAVAGNGTTIVVGGVEHSVDSAKLSDSIVELNTVLGDLQSNSSFTITYYDSDGVTVLKTETLAYGSMPSYTPAKDGYMFTGWSPELSAVAGDASYVASWEENITFATASWARIAEISESGRASEYFKVGDEKTFDYQHNGYLSSPITAVIIGFNHENLSDGTGKAGITCMLKPLISVSIERGATYTSYIHPKYNTILTWLPSELQSVIKPVNKIYQSGYDGITYAILSTVSAKLWAMSLSEWGYSYGSKSKLGEKYEDAISVFPLTAPFSSPSGTYKYHLRDTENYNGITGWYVKGNSQSAKTAKMGSNTGSYGTAHLVAAFCI